MRIVAGKTMICLLVPVALVVLGGMQPAQAQTCAPTVTCSVATEVLKPPDGTLRDVGLTLSNSGFSGCVTYTVNVYSNGPQRNDGDNDNDDAALATWDGTTLQLRASRVGWFGAGRVYLIIVTATDGTSTAQSACTVVVPRNSYKYSLANISALAAWVEVFTENNNFVPPWFIFKIL